MDQNIYKGATIQNIRFRRSGVAGGGDILYATLVGADGELLIVATLDYVVGALKARLKPCQ